MFSVWPLSLGEQETPWPWVGTGVIAAAMPYPQLLLFYQGSHPHLCKIISFLKEKYSFFFPHQEELILMLDGHMYGWGLFLCLFFNIKYQQLSFYKLSGFLCFHFHIRTVTAILVYKLGQFTAGRLQIKLKLNQWILLESKNAGTFFFSFWKLIESIA